MVDIKDMRRNICPGRMIGNRIKSFVFAVFLVIANLLSLYSAVLVQSAQAKEPSPITINNNLHNTSVPNTGNNAMFTDPSTGVDLINNLKYFATQNAQMVSLVEQVATQEEPSDISINDNLNTGLVSTDNTDSDSDNSTLDDPDSSTSDSIPSVSGIWQAIVGYLGEFTNTSPNKGSTTGLAGQFFEGTQAIFYYTIGGGWIPKLGWVIAQYTEEFLEEWLGPTIGNFLIARIVAFKDSPDVSYQNDAFSIQMRNLNHAVRDFSYDLLLLFFILAIWRYWVNAVWGKGNLWGAVGRIILATAAIIAWPEIYHYIILIANAASDVFIVNISAEDLGHSVVHFFVDDLAFTATNKTGLMIPFDWILEIVINAAIGGALLISLLAFFVEKAIQLTLIVMAYVFGPFFLVCIVSPDTEKHTSDFLKIFAEATLWSFIWGGLIVLFVYTILGDASPDAPISKLTSNITLPLTDNPYNHWFVMLLMLGILQAMLQVPRFINRGGVSPIYGIFELGLAAHETKNALALLYGTHGLYTQFRHALRDPNSHRWPLNLPNVSSKDAANYASHVSTGDTFGKKTFAGMATSGSANPALAGASAGLLSTQTASPAQMSALLRAQTSAMTPAQAAVLSSGQSILKPAQTTALTPTQTAALSQAQAALTPAQTAALSQAQAASLSQAQAALNPAQTAALSEAQAALAPAQTARLTRAQLAALTPVQTAALSLEQISTLTRTQIASFTPAQAAGLTRIQISALTPGQTSALTPEQIAAFSPRQIGAFSSAQMNNFNAGQMAALSQTTMSALTQASRSGLPSGRSSRRNQLQIQGGLPRENIQTMTGRQPQTTLAAWLAQSMRLFGDVTFHELPKNEKAGITFDDIGVVDTFGVPQNASLPQRALALAATSFAAGEDSRGRFDPGFEDAMLMTNMHRSMSRGGPFNPWNGTNMLGGVNQKWMDRIALWLSDGKADTGWKNIMYLREKRIQNKAVVEGINAYMHGKRDGKNGIADYWTDKRGPFDAALQVYRLTDPTAKAGGINQNALEIRDILKAAKIEVTPTTQTAASHPFILSLSSTEKPLAVHAMIRLLQSSAVSQYGEQATRMEKPQLETFYDGLMKHVGEDHVQAAAAIARNYGLNYVTPQNTNKVVATQRRLYNDSLNKDDFNKSAFVALGRLPTATNTANLNYDFSDNDIDNDEEEDYE